MNPLMRSTSVGVAYQECIKTDYSTNLATNWNIGSSVPSYVSGTNWLSFPGTTGGVAGV